MRLIYTTQSNFKEIRQAGAVYVDKTQQIYDCIGGSTGDKFFFLSRPRRFGKSLLCSTLQELFLGNRKLFKGLWIDKSDWSWKKHPIIHVSMALVARKTATSASIEKSLRTLLKNIQIEHDLKIDQTLDLPDTFSSLITKLHKKYKLQVVVIIDEYDKPMLDLINANNNYHDVHGLLRDFYGQLKYTETHLRFVLITGVYKFTQTSIFSNLNNLRDLSLAPIAHDLVGYTQEEVEANFAPEIAAMTKKLKQSKPEVLQTLKDQHNGYVFGYDEDNGTLSPSVYNSYAVNMVFTKNTFAKNAWFGTGTPTFLINQLEQRNFEPLQVDQLEISASKLVNSCDPSNISVETLLYYAGYQTIKECDPATGALYLKYPNLDVATAMAEEILPRMGNQSDNSWRRMAYKVHDALLTHNADVFQETMNICFAGIHHKLFTEFESFYQTIIMFVLQRSNLVVNAEVPTNLGYIDLVVTTRQANYILEIKLNKTARQAINQIKEKQYYQQLEAQGVPIYLVGINCSSKKRGITAVQIELLSTLKVKRKAKPMQKKSPVKKSTVKKVAVKKATK